MADILTSLQLMPEHVNVLDNGVTLHSLNAGDTPVCQLSILLPGSILEAKIPTVAQLAADMFVEGSTLHIGAEVAEVLDFNGAWVRSTADSHCMNVTLFCTSDSVDKVLPTLMECISQPAFNEEALEMIRGRLAANRAMALEKVSVLSSEACLSLMAGKDSPYSVFPTPEDIMKVTAADLREFHSRLVNPRRMHVFIAGRYSEEVLQFLKEQLSALPLNPHPFEVKECEFEAQPPTTMKIPVPESVQSALTIGIPTVNRNHPDYIPLRVAVIALGGYFGSRLMTNIREDKGYTYGIHASLNGLNDGAYIQISAQYDATYEKELLRQVNIEIERLRTELLSDTELSHVKMYMSTQLANGIDTVFAALQQYMLPYTVGAPATYFADQVRKLQSINAETIREMVRRYIRIEDMRIAIAGR